MKKKLLWTAAVLTTMFAMALYGAVVNGYLDFAERAAPGNPASGNARLYVNNSTGVLTCILSGGTSCMPSGTTYPGSGVPNSTGSAWGTSYGVQGSDANLMSAGSVSGTGNLLCLDGNGGTTTTGCIVTSTGYTPFANLTAPSTSGMSWINQGSSSVDVSGGLLTMTATGTGSDNIRFYGKATLSTPYSVIGAFMPPIQSGIAGSSAGSVSGYSTGIALSDGTKFITFAVAFAAATAYTPQIQINEFTNATTFSSTPYQNDSFSFCPATWFRIKDDGTNRTFSVSCDPTNQGWTTLYSQTDTTFLTATKAGFAMDLYSSSINGLTVNSQGFVSFSQSSP
jgi:hypothetical protein